MNNGLTDLELLELERAAKAAEYEFGVIHGQPHVRCEDGWTPWNPRDDDGDALRLAVVLSLTIKIMGDHVKVGWRGIGEQWPGEEAPTPDGLPAATRRAIVRAAVAVRGIE